MGGCTDERLNMCSRAGFSLVQTVQVTLRAPRSAQWAGGERVEPLLWRQRLTSCSVTPSSRLVNSTETSSFSNKSPKLEQKEGAMGPGSKGQGTALVSSMCDKDSDERAEAGTVFVPTEHTDTKA